MQVTSATTSVANLFQVELQKKVTSIIHFRDITSLPLRFVDFCADPEPQTYLQLRGRVQIIIRLLVASEVLRRGMWGVAGSGQRCYRCQSLRCCRRRWGLFCQGDPPWEGYQIGTEVTCC